MAKVETTDSYVEMIMATNGDATHDLFYFDNARLLFAQGEMNDGHVDAKRCRAWKAPLTNPTNYQSAYFNGNSSFTLSDLATFGQVSER